MLDKRSSDILINIDTLQLRLIDEHVLRKAFATKNDTELQVFLGVDTLLEVEKEREQLQKNITTYKQSLLYFQIIQNQKVIGWCGYHLWYTLHARAELGYTLKADKYKRKGYMSLVLPWVLSYGFKEMNLHRIEAYVADYNIPSVKLLVNNNFTREGVLREHYYTNNRYEDSAVYSLLKTEFKE